MDLLFLSPFMIYMGASFVCSLPHSLRRERARLSLGKCGCGGHRLSGVRGMPVLPLGGALALLSAGYALCLSPSGLGLNPLRDWSVDQFCSFVVEAPPVCVRALGLRPIFQISEGDPPFEWCLDELCLHLILPRGDSSPLNGASVKTIDFRNAKRTWQKYVIGARPLNSERGDTYKTRKMESMWISRMSSSSFCVFVLSLQNSENGIHVDITNEQLLLLC